MADFVHCDSCYKQPSAQGNVFFLTSCFHIICRNCLQKETGNPVLCIVCKHEVKVVEINSALDPKLQSLFKTPKKLVAAKLAILKRKCDFQRALMNSLLNHLKKQRVKLEQLMQYCQKQSKITKDKEKEMADLREWVNVAEIKIKENEQEKASLQKEIDELKKLTSRFGRSSSFENTINKMFVGSDGISGNDVISIESTSIVGNFGTGDITEQSVPSFLRTPSEMDVSSNLNTVTCNLASPQSSVNNSVVSEMTTPKMLGLRKKGLSNSGGSHPYRKTPTGLDAQNPYVEVFTRSSALQKHSSRTSTTKSNVFAGARPPVSRLSSKSPTTPGYVTPDPIIPLVNAPSSMTRSNF